MTEPIDVVTYGAHVPVSTELRQHIDIWAVIGDEINAIIREQLRLDAIGPYHGPPIPDDIRAHRRRLARIANIRHNLTGHATGPYRRSTP